MNETAIEIRLRDALRPLRPLVVMVAFSPSAAQPSVAHPISSFSIETECGSARVQYSPDAMSGDRLKRLLRLWGRNNNCRVG
jgi:hypothetical protein